MKKNLSVLSEDLPRLEALLLELKNLEVSNAESLRKMMKRFPQSNGDIFSKHQLVNGYMKLVSAGKFENDPRLMQLIRMKPTRTISGVTPVTVLTKPFPCPGKCIFCPNDVRMPKSYLHDEPGAQRAERNQFDPYLQTYNRLQAFKNIGHSTDKIEIIVLGGTWSFYPEPYQIWYIKRCFEALNDFGQGKDQREEVERKYEQKLKQLHVSSRTQNSVVEHAEIHGEEFDKTYNQVISQLYTAPDKLMGLDKDETATWDELYEQQIMNETATCRSVGLVIETRPDYISEAEVIRIRKLGCTKTQIGVQSLNDEVLSLNKRGHDVAATRKAFKMLRQMGFKIHAHWMPNLYGSTTQKDIEDFKKLFSDPDFCPDELKIYPCSLIDSAELMQYYKRGEWKPYSKEELVEVLTNCFEITPEYCRLTRVIRDIPSPDIVVGNKQTNLREVIDAEVKKRNITVNEIRAREIRGQEFDPEKLELKETIYETSVSTEIFLQYITPENKILAFLRLSLPKVPPFLDELKNSAMIREVHVYGVTTELIKKAGDLEHVQHLGFGKKLIARAKEIAREKQFEKLQVISAIGTREYYRKQVFSDGILYQYTQLL